MMSMSFESRRTDSELLELRMVLLTSNDANSDNSVYCITYQPLCIDSNVHASSGRCSVQIDSK